MTQHAIQAPQSAPDGVAGGAFRAFFNILSAWELSDEDGMTLLGAPRSTYFRWKRDPANARLSRDVLERLSYVFGIYKNLHILLPRKDAADSWLKRPNTAPLFGGLAPIERLRAGHVADLYVVREYLDAQRSGWG